MSISVDSAVDIAKEAADMILLERSLLVLDEGVLEGRRVFSNIVKYVRMGASSNFGNMFSVLGASIFVPFLPMLPVQILANNLLYDGWFVESLLTQTLIIHVIRTDKVPFLQSRSSRAVLGMSLLVTAIGVVIPYSPVGRYLGMTPLPWGYWPLLAATLGGYLVLTQFVKSRLLRRGWI